MVAIQADIDIDIGRGSVVQLIQMIQYLMVQDSRKLSSDAAPTGNK